MFQLKARRVVPVLALFAALSLLPLTDASAAVRARSTTRASAGISLLAQIEAQLTSFWTAALETVWGDAGPRMDDNG